MQKLKLSTPTLFIIPEIDHDMRIHQLLLLTNIIGMIPHGIHFEIHFGLQNIGCLCVTGTTHASFLKITLSYMKKGGRVTTNLIYIRRVRNNNIIDNIIIIILWLPYVEDY